MEEFRREVGDPDKMFVEVKGVEHLPRPTNEEVGMTKEQSAIIDVRTGGKGGRGKGVGKGVERGEGGWGGEGEGDREGVEFPFYIYNVCACTFKA